MTKVTKKRDMSKPINNLVTVFEPEEVLVVQDNPDDHFLDESDELYWLLCDDDGEGG